MSNTSNQQAVVDAMQQASFYPHVVDKITIVETHISWVFLTGEYAYKIKKPVNFGFLDFSTLEKRHYYCTQELRLNKRLADDIYLQVIAITRQDGTLSYMGDGEIVDYAVQMKQFDPGNQLDHLIAQHKLTNQMIDELASRIALFHQQINQHSSDDSLGSALSAFHAADDNFKQLQAIITDPDQLSQLSTLRSWTRENFGYIENVLSERKQQGFVRECHGDMHLGNMALLDDHILIFDGIEFNDEFRWIDVMSELAFVFMDLDFRKSASQAWRLLNIYLEETGDYPGMQVFRFFLVYRAMVRAKVAGLRLAQSAQHSESYSEYMQQYLEYTRLAESYTRQKTPRLYITMGASGSGKTTQSQHVLENQGFIRLRSDIERKRLFGFKATENTKSGLNSGIYSRNASTKTYQQLGKLARLLLEAKFSVIIDATFLQKAERQQFRDMAHRLNAQFGIIHCNVERMELEKRINQRHIKGNDASEAGIAVLEKQLKTLQPLDKKELEEIVNPDTLNG